MAVPMVIQQDGRGERAFDVYSRLLRDRIVYLGTPIDDQVANVLIAQLLILAAEDADREIRLYINSPGGEVYAGLAIYDAMQYVDPPVTTICVGMAMSAAAVILAGGAPGQRLSLPNSRVMIHQGSAGMRGAPSDMEIHLREALAMTRRMAEILAHHTGQPIDRIEKDMDRDYFMGAAQAQEYGIVDQVLPVKRGIAAPVTFS